MFKICLLHILKSELRPTDQKKKNYLKMLLLVGDAPGHPRGLVKIHNKKKKKETQQDECCFHAY